MKKPILIALLLAATVTVLVISPAGPAIAQEARNVFVTNFPKIFNITGAVSVEGPVKHARFSALRDIVVPPINPKDTVRLIPGGVVESDGFTNMVLGLQGQTKGEVFRAGTVGVFLVPEEEAIIKVYEEKGLMPFSTEISVPSVSGASPYFSSSSTKTPIAFPRYRTLFYNTSDKTVTVSLYAYLTN